MHIFQKVRELHLPSGEYVVVGGGVLVALGLLDWDGDVDITISPEAFERFQRQGWKRADWQGIAVLKHEVYDVGMTFGRWNVRDLLKDALVINAIPFISLEKLLEWKRQTRRPKDLFHIELIEKYQQAQRTTAA